MPDSRLGISLRQRSENVSRFSRQQRFFIGALPLVPLALVTAHAWVYVTLVLLYEIAVLPWIVEGVGWRKLWRAR